MCADVQKLAKDYEQQLQRPRTPDSPDRVSSPMGTSHEALPASNDRQEPAQIMSDAAVTQHMRM